MSWFQTLKLGLLAVFPLPRPVAHALVGLIILVLAWSLKKRRAPSWWLLLPPGIVAVIGETLDVLDAVSAGESVRWWHSLLDVAWTLGPAAMLLAVAIGRRREPTNSE